jgi:hypothetical protein
VRLGEIVACRYTTSEIVHNEIVDSVVIEHHFWRISRGFRRMLPALHELINDNSPEILRLKIWMPFGDEHHT